MPSEFRLSTVLSKEKSKSESVLGQVEREGVSVQAPAERSWDRKVIERESFLYFA